MCKTRRKKIQNVSSLKFKHITIFNPMLQYNLSQIQFIYCGWSIPQCTLIDLVRVSYISPLFESYELFEADESRFDVGLFFFRFFLAPASCDGDSAPAVVFLFRLARLVSLSLVEVLLFRDLVSVSGEAACFLDCFDLPWRLGVPVDPIWEDKCFQLEIIINFRLTIQCLDQYNIRVG